MKNKDNKDKTEKGSPKWFLPILISIILLSILVIFVSYNLGNTLTGNVINTPTNQNQQIQNQQTKKSCRDVQVPYDYLEEYQETVPYTDRECETKELAYSITNFVMSYNTCDKQEYICKNTFLGICTEKTYYCVDKSVSCALNLKNLDNEERGTWQTTFSYIDKNTRDIVKKDTISKFLYPQTEEILTSAARISSTGVEGDANRDITCTYGVIAIPTKQVCRDVTQYREVTKTRAVTRYRTEQKCD